MQKRLVIVLGFASVVGLIVSVLVYRVVAEFRASARQQTTEEIVVAAVNMDLAETITSKHVKVLPWPRQAVPAHVARVAAHPLVAPGAERVLPVPRRTFTGEQHHADRGILAGVAKRLLQLDQRLRAEGVAHLGAIEGDARDAVRLPVGDVVVFLDGLPVGPLAHPFLSRLSSGSPAPRPLERNRIVLAEDGQILIDKSRKFQFELGQWIDPEAFLRI